MKKYFLLFYFFRVCLLSNVDDDYNRVFVEIHGDDYTNNESGLINGTLYRTVKRYYCSSASASTQQTLLYGTKAWTFPEQNVNLTLQYPSEFNKAETNVEYILTELNVILFLEGTSSRGYITRGGMLQNHISMTFIMRNTTRLTYQFWLFGIPRGYPAVTENYNTMYNMC